MFGDGDIELWLPGQYPEIGCIRTGHQGILIGFVVEFDDVIATVEGAEERDPEPADIPVADKIGLAFRPLPALFRPVLALVQHPYTTIATPAVFRAHLLQTAFKRMVEPGNFILGS